MLSGWRLFAGEASASPDDGARVRELLQMLKSKDCCRFEKIWKRQVKENASHQSSSGSTERDSIENVEREYLSR